MKPLTVTFLAILMSLHAYAERPFLGNLKESKVLAESKNKSGEKLVVREFKIQSESGTPGGDTNAIYFRLEFYSHDILFYAETMRKYTDPVQVSLEWLSDSECEITLVAGWTTVKFSRDDREHWKLSQRID